MDFRTKYGFDSYLYFLYRGKVKSARPDEICIVPLSLTAEDEETTFQNLLIYRFTVDKKVVEKYENEVFKRRADLVRSLS